MNGSCYELFNLGSHNYEEARDYCKGRGGDIWLPNLYDGHIYECFFREFPEIWGEYNKCVKDCVLHGLMV